MDTWINLLKEKYHMSDTVCNQYKQYAALLKEENKKYNLTALTDDNDIFHYHICDSIELLKINTLDSTIGIADVGSGCGVPGLLLACCLPDTPFFLIEVIGKRISFLKKAIEELKLTNVSVVEKDFKSVVRKKEFEADTFLARASLPCKDLLYLYSGASKYQNAKIIYWATEHQIKEDLINEQKKGTCVLFPYTVGTRKRQYAIITPQ